MRFLPLFIFLFIAQYSIAKQVTVEGQLTNFAYYDSITMVEFTYENPFSETVKISDKGEFSFKLDIEHPNFFQLVLDDKNHLMMVLSPGDKVKVEANANAIQTDFSVLGSSQTELFYKATKQFDVFAHVRDSLAMVHKLQNDQITNAEIDYTKNFIAKNSTSLSTLMLIDKLNIEENLEIYLNLDSSLLANYPHNKIVQDFHKDVQKMTSQRIGYPIGDIELQNAKGEIVTLSSLKGKVVLIDFWATWCMPCKAEIPNIKNVYQKYKEKGFEVYSISIDRDKSKWLAEEKSLPWINVYDEASTYAQKFNVASIPFTILIDKKGHIIRKNVRGAELGELVGKILD